MTKLCFKISNNHINALFESLCGNRSRVDRSKLYDLVIKCYLSTFIDERCPIHLFWGFAKFSTVVQLSLLWLNNVLLSYWVLFMLFC